MFDSIEGDLTNPQNLNPLFESLFFIKDITKRFVACVCYFVFFTLCLFNSVSPSALTPKRAFELGMSPVDEIYRESFNKSLQTYDFYNDEKIQLWQPLLLL